VIRYQITDGTATADQQAWLERLNPEADFIQIREPDLEAGRLAELTRLVLRRARARVLVNDRADVAIAAGAHGVHLRGDSSAAGLYRSIAPPGFLVSVACHSLHDVRRAADEGADYALLAPIFSPLSKPDTRMPLGTDAITAAAAFGIPVIALGGITEENALECVAAGAAGVAGITLFAAER
jgi:thiamine-phosphate pyrophosphorylase